MGPRTDGGDRAVVFREILSSLSGELVLTVSSPYDFVGLVEALTLESVEGTLRVLVDPETARTVRGRFVIAAQTAEHVEADDVTVRIDSERPLSTLLVGTEQIRGVASVSERTVTAMTADADGPFVASAREAFDERWASAEEFDLRTPAYTRFLESLEEALGAPTREDVEAVFDHAANTNVDVGPVEVCLLMGARNEVQFYELGLWGESERVASRAKFSREKQRLEERGLLTTEKIPADIGRPRQRLVLPDAHADADPIELMSRSLTE